MEFANRFFQVQPQESKQTIEQFLKTKGFSARTISSLIAEHKLHLNNEPAANSSVVEKHDLVQIFQKPAEKLFFLDPAHPQIIHSTANFFVVEKPLGTNSIPDASHKENNVFFLLKQFFHLTNDNQELFVVHRLDKVTSGLMIIARSADSAKQLINLFKQRMIKKNYWAIISGYPPQKKFIVSAPLKPTGKAKKALIGYSGRAATTQFEVVKTKGDLSLLQCQPITGRTHQIRSHLKFIDLPIVNDPLYSKHKGERMFLHAFSLAFVASEPNQKWEFFSSLPERFSLKLNASN